MRTQSQAASRLVTHLGQEGSTASIAQGDSIIIATDCWEGIEGILGGSWPDAEVLLYAAGEGGQSFWIAFQVLQLRSKPGQSNHC